MADEGEQAAPPAAKKSGGVMGTLVSGIGIFVLTLAAVIVGGGINAKLHPTPEYRLDKDGKITPVMQTASSGGHGEEGGGKAAVYYAIDPPLVVNFEDGSVVRFLQITMEVMAHDPKTIESVTKNIPLIRNNLLLLMSNRNYQSMMSREGKESLRKEALNEVNNVQKKEGGEPIDDLLFTTFRGAVMAATETAAAAAAMAHPANAISEEEVSALLEKNHADGVRPYDFTAQRINRTELPMLQVIAKSFADRIGTSLSTLLGRDASAQFTALDSAKAADLQAALPMPASLAIVRLKPLPGFSFVTVEPALLLTLLDGFFGGSGRATSDSQAAIAPAAQRFLALMLRSFAADWTVAWTPVAPLEFELVKQETNPR